MKHIIFLDIDGVLNSASYQMLMVQNDCTIEDKYGHLFDPECVKQLGRIIDATGAQIVISSDWKDTLGLDGLREMWRERKLPGAIIDVTPTFSSHRGDEIERWLENTDEVNSYAIIDDMPGANFNSSQQIHLVRTDGYLGITPKIAEKIIKILQESHGYTTGI